MVLGSMNLKNIQMVVNINNANNAQNGVAGVCWANLPPTNGPRIYAELALKLIYPKNLFRSFLDTQSAICSPFFD